MPPPTVDERRINGLQPPWHPLQIVTWLLFPALLSHYFLFLMPLMWDNRVMVITLSVAFGLASVVSAWSGHMTCAIDPSDDAVAGESTNSDPTVYCYLCETNVYVSNFCTNDAVTLPICVQQSQQQ